jgi:hypothetical protein
MTSIKQYDIIIIGTGISGLYSAYKNPNKSILILEKYKKQWIGGRMSNEYFYGTEIVTGAGIGRKNKDKLLIQLMKELDIPFYESKFSPHYAYNIEHVDVKQILYLLKTAYNKNPTKKTFKQFAKPILGVKLYNQFLTYIGFTDYENEDIHDTLYNYGMEDNYTQFNILEIPWKELVLKLYNKIGPKKFKFSSNVTSIEKYKDLEQEKFIINIENGPSYICNKVILATTITSIQKLLPHISLYKKIHSQPFLRVYAKFSKQSLPFLNKYVKDYTIVSRPLQKIIPMNSEKGVYMIAYSDNESALYLKKYLINNEANCDFFAKLVEKSIGIPFGQLNIIAIKDFYWPVGTHYYEPLSGISREEFIFKAQHPEPGLLVVGEVVSLHQGWTEGALESVNAVIN